MTQKEAKQLFEVVKNDDLTSFCVFTKDEKNLNISFGRFPLLSVCYLYDSNKIIKKFEKKLLQIENYQVVNEPFELYLKFKMVAKKSIRLYASKQDFVMPIEILAMQGKDGLVKKYYKILKKTQKNDDFLQKIYNFNKQNTKFENNKIKISHKKLSRQTKLTLLISNVSFLFVAVLITAILLVVSNIYGLGTLHSPKKISNATQFASLSNKGCYATLLEDIVLEDSTTLNNFSGTIFGNDKTITINYDYDDFLINKLSGKIQNVNIVFKNDISKTLSQNLSLLANENNGEIKNINIVVENKINFTFDGEKTYFSGLCITNNKYIKNCSVQFNAEVNSANTKDNLVSFIAVDNYGTISSCDVLEGSSIISNNVDVGGIVSQNFANANISSCNNHASLCQNTSSNAWSPNVAGIATLNLGTITNSINYGSLTANHSGEEKTNSGVFIGGISAQNYSVIEHCKNIGDIISSTNVITIYAGGIAGYTAQQNNSNPTITSCGSIGNFNLTKIDDTVFMFCGGISGFMVGMITNCYSIATYCQSYSQEKSNMIGLLIGASSGQAFLSVQIYLDISNDHCLLTEQSTKPVAIVYTNMGYIYVENLDADITIHATKQDVEQTDVYW